VTRSAGLNIRCSAFSVGCSMFSESGQLCRFVSLGRQTMRLFTKTPPLQHSIPCHESSLGQAMQKSKQRTFHQLLTSNSAQKESRRVKPLCSASQGCRPQFSTTPPLQSFHPPFLLVFPKKLCQHTQSTRLNQGNRANVQTITL
jgi:hypothetical protein